MRGNFEGASLHACGAGDRQGEARRKQRGVLGDHATHGEVLDLILSAAKRKAPGEDEITAEVPGAGGRPMAAPTTLVCRRLQRAMPNVWKGGLMATISSGKNKTRGVLLNDHVGKILERWI